MKRWKLIVACLGFVVLAGLALRTRNDTLTGLVICIGLMAAGASVAGRRRPPRV